MTLCAGGDEKTSANGFKIATDVKYSQFICMKHKVGLNHACMPVGYVVHSAAFSIT